MSLSLVPHPFFRLLVGRHPFCQQRSPRFSALFPSPNSWNPEKLWTVFGARIAPLIDLGVFIFRFWALPMASMTIFFSRGFFFSFLGVARPSFDWNNQSACRVESLHRGYSGKSAFSFFFGEIWSCPFLWPFFVSLPEPIILQNFHVFPVREAFFLRQASSF